MITYEAPATAAHLLKQQTAEPHRALEAIVLPHLHALQTLDDYNGLLKKFYGYFKPVERLIEHSIDASVLPDMSQRRKAEWLLADLTFSKAHIEDLPLATDLPQLKHAQQALGAMYVLEGATLGGRGITQLLLKNKTLRLQPAQVSFFNGYGDATGRMWTSFLETLNRFSDNRDAVRQMVAAATETFVLFEKWLRKP